MARISPAPPKPRYPREVNVRHTEAAQASIQVDAARIAGPVGFKVRKPNWGVRVFQFDTPEKAETFRGRLWRWRHEEELRDLRRRPCETRLRYEEAAVAQHAVVWGLASGVICDVVRTYRRERADCSTHGMPNWRATETLVRAAPTIDFDRGRQMVDAMLAYVIARHSTWFWTGLAGDHIINRF